MMDFLIVNFKKGSIVGVWGVYDLFVLGVNEVIRCVGCDEIKVVFIDGDKVVFISGGFDMFVGVIG